MSPRTFALLLPFTSVLSAAAIAATPPPQVPYQQVDNRVDLPALGGTVQRACAGDIDGDLAPDAAILADGRVFVAFGPATYGSVVEIDDAGWAIDLSLMPELGPQAPCQIAVTRADGVFVVGRQTDPGDPDPWVIQQVLGADASLLGATRVRSADLDGNGRNDLVVVLADEKTVRVVLQQLDGTWTPFASPFMLQTKVRELAALQYDNDYPLELAIQIAGSARVHELDGTFVAMARNVVAGSPAGMAVMPIPGTTRSRIAYLATATGGGYDLHLLQHGLALNTWFVGGLQPRSLLAADHDQDGDFDLLVDTGVNGLTVLLSNSEADFPAPYPDPTHPFSYHLAGASEFPIGSQPGVTQIPCWGDLDNDSWPDLLVPNSQASGSWRLEYRPRIPAPFPSGAQGITGESHPVFLQADWAQPNTGGTLAAPQLRLLVANVWGADGRSHLQVRVWRKKTPPGPGTETFGRFDGRYLRTALQSDQIGNYWVTLQISSALLPDLGPDSYLTAFQSIDENPLADDPLAEGGDNSTVYFVELCSLQVVGGVPQSTGRKQLTGLALNTPDSTSSGSSLSYLLGLPGSWGQSIHTAVHSSNFALELENYKIGGLVPMPAMPAFAPGFMTLPEVATFP
jgi:hypothetical protein